MSMWQKFNQIINKYIGKRVDYNYDKSYQCVDFVKQYVLEQYWVTLNPFGPSALTGWNSGSPFNSSWKRVVYTQWTFPEVGDIVFLDKTYGNKYGHVCVADANCNQSVLNIIEQNAWDGLGSWLGWNAVTRRSIKYKSNRGNCLGWFTLIR